MNKDTSKALELSCSIGNITSSSFVRLSMRERCSACVKPVFVLTPFEKDVRSDRKFLFYKRLLHRKLPEPKTEASSNSPPAHAKSLPNSLTGHQSVCAPISIAM